MKKKRTSDSKVITCSADYLLKRAASPNIKDGCSMSAVEEEEEEEEDEEGGPLP